MSRGKLGFLTSLILLGMVFLNPSPVSAQLTVSGAAAGTDNLDPAPVTAVTTVVDLAGPDVTITWTISDDDFVRQAPVGTDFTSGGAFSNVSDVAGYKVWRDDGAAAGAQVIATLGSGEMSYLDAAVVNGVFYTYSITAIDAAGNQSAPVASEQVLVGSAPRPVITPDPPGNEDIQIVQRRTVSVIVQTSAGDEALLLNTDPNNQEAVVKQNNLKDQSLQLFLQANPGIARDRVTVTIKQGSIIIVFEVVDDPEDPEAPTAAEAAETFEVLLVEEPQALVEQIDVVEAVVGFSSTALVDVDFGILIADETATQSFTFTNNATEDDALLFLTIAVDGAGYAVDTEELTIGPNGESASFNVTFDAAAVNSLNGAYDGVLSILSNDPNKRLTVINLAATIEGGNSAQRIDLIGSAFPFGNIATGTTQARTMTVRNLGDLDLSGTLALDGDAAFEIDESSFLLAGGEGLAVSIEFSPTEEVDYSATITITSDDPNNPELTVELSGAGTSGEEALLETDADGNLVTDDDGNFIIILGDFDGTADVGFQDFFIFADNFGADDLTDPDVNAATDLDNSGDVGFQDFFIFADNFGKSGVYQILGSSATAFSATLSGDQQNPAVTTSAAGSGTFSLNAAETDLTFNVTATGVTDFTAAHFHNAAAATNGGVVRGFDATTEITDDGAGNITISGTWSSTDDSALTEALVDELEAGNIYVNIHTTTNGSGEIRGQVIED